MKYCNEVDYGLEEWRYARWYEQSTRETAALLEKRTLSKELRDKWSPYLNDMDFRRKGKPISRQIPADGGIVELTPEQLSEGEKKRREGEKKRRYLEKEMNEANAMLRERAQKQYEQLKEQYIFATYRNPAPVQIADGAITGKVPGEMDVIYSAKGVGKSTITMGDLAKMLGKKD